MRVEGAHDLEAAQLFLRDALREAAPLPENERLAERANALVGPNPRLSPLEQLEVYRDQFFLRHVASLEEDFPCVVHLLDKDGFRNLARDYLAAHPPSIFDLNKLGAKMPGFLESSDRHGGDPLLADAARFDWAFMEAFDTPDAPLLRPETIAHAPEDAWPGARIVFHPSLRFVRLAHPLDAFRRSVRKGEAAARPAPAREDAAIYRGADQLLYSVVIEPMAFELLTALAAGQALGTACEAVAATLPATEANALGPRVGAWFQEWTSRGWVTDVRFRD